VVSLKESANFELCAEFPGLLQRCGHGPPTWGDRAAAPGFQLKERNGCRGLNQQFKLGVICALVRGLPGLELGVQSRPLAPAPLRFGVASAAVPDAVMDRLAVLHPPPGASQPQIELSAGAGARLGWGLL